MEFATQYVLHTWELVLDTGIYLLAGIILAGILHVIMPTSVTRRILGEGYVGPVIRASAIGMPLPLCSCSVIPLAASLKRDGASNGAVVSFLITTPMTGVDSILPTYGVFGLGIATFRVVGSLFTGLIAGILTELASTEARPVQSMTFTDLQKKADSVGDAKPRAPHERTRLALTPRNVFGYAFNELFSDISTPVIVGILAAGAVVTFIPESFEQFVSNNATISYLIALAIGLPVYVCSVSAIPVAAAMVGAGFSPGAAFVFLAAAPATNLVTMNVIRGFLGPKPLLIYVASIIGGSVSFAVIVDIFIGDYVRLGATLGNIEGFGIVGVIAAVSYLLITAWYSVVRPIVRKIRGEEEDSCGCGDGCCSTDAGVPAGLQMVASDCDCACDGDCDDDCDCDCDGECSEDTCGCGSK